MGLASINIKFTADLASFSSSIQNASRQLKKIGGEMQSVGTALSIGVTAPIIAFGAASVSAFNDSAQAIAQVNAALESTGGTVGYTSEQLQKMAADMQAVTLFDDDEILKKATANLLTFNKIQGETFKAAQQAALDLSTRLDGDLQGAALQVGKALQDPVKGITALKKAGVSFSDGQVATIKSMVAMNDVAGAQAIVLAELNKEFGGSAEAAAAVGTGSFTQLSNQIGDMGEEFGKIIVDGLQPFVQLIKDAVTWIQGLSPEVKKTIVVIAGIAAALGPVILALGTFLTLLPTIGPVIAAGFAAITGPIGLIIAGVALLAVVVVKNFDTIKQKVVDVANYFIDLYNSSMLFRAGVQYIVLSFKNMWEVAKFAFNAILDIGLFVIQSLITPFKALGKVIKGALTLNFDEIKEGLAYSFTETIKNTKTLFKNISADGAKAFKGIGENLVDAYNNTVNGKTLAKIVLGEDAVDASGVKKAVKKGAQEGAEEGVTAGIKSGSVAFYDAQITALRKLQNEAATTRGEWLKYENQIESVQKKIDALKEISNNVALKPIGINTPKTQSDYDAKIADLKNYQQTVADTKQKVDDAQKQIDALEFQKALKFDPEAVIKTGQSIEEMQTRIEASAAGMSASLNGIKIDIEKFNEDISKAFNDTAVSLAEGMGAAIGAALAGGKDVMKNFGSLIWNTLANMLITLGKIAIQTAVSISAIKAALKSLNPAVAIAAGIAAIALGTVIKSKINDAGAFANGGIVGGNSFYGDKILARVNSGELILNGKQQERLYSQLNAGGSNMTIGFSDVVIEGDKLRLVLDRNDKKKNRIG